MSETKAPAVPAPAIIEQFFQSILGPLGAMHIAPLLVEAEHIEERVKNLVNTFEKYPEYIEPFGKLIKSLQGGKQESPISLEEQIRYFNTKHTRYWVLVILMNRVLKIKELQLDMNTGRLPARAHDLLKYAHLAREGFGEESRYKDVVFACGFIFDYLFYLQRTTILNLGQAKYDDFLGQCYTKALEQGKRITALSKFKAQLEFEKLTPATAFLRQLSAMSIVLLKMNEALEFYKKVEATKPTEPLKLAQEMRAFGVHTGILGSYLGHLFPVFEKLGEIMAVWGFPYMAAKNKQNVADAAAMGMFGVAVCERGITADHFGAVAKPFVEMPELRYLDFTVTKEVRVEAKI